MIGRARMVLAGVCLASVLAAALAGAQERVMIGGPPAPDQTLRLRMTQTTDVDMTPIGEPPPGMPPAMRMTGQTVLVMRQHVGKHQADGRIRLDLTYEEVSHDMKMNGKPLPVPPEFNDAIKGKTIGMWIDRKFQIVEISTPEGFPIPTELVKGVMTQTLASIPHQEMAVGESVTLPFSMPLPFPVPGAADATLTGRSTTTLVKVAPEGNDQVATLDAAVQASMDKTTDAPDGGRIRVRLKMDGAGTAETGIKSGLVRSSNMRSNFEAEFEPISGSRPGTKMRGTMTMTVAPAP